MRRPYEIYNRFKRAQKKYLQAESESAFKVCPKNCCYNREVFFADRNLHLRMCALGQDKGQNNGELDPSKLLICTSVSQAEECNAYAPRYKTEEDVVALVKEKAATPESKVKNFPELVILEWVMGNDLHSLKAARSGPLTRLIFWLVDKLETVALRLNPDKSK